MFSKLGQIGDWFWEGVLLKQVKNPTIYKMYVYLYGFIVIKVSLFFFLVLPSFIYVYKNNITISIHLALSGFSLIIMLFVSLYVFIKTFKNYKNIKSN